MKIRIIVFDGVDEIDFIGPYEVLRRAAKLARPAEVDVRLVSVEPQAQVTAANGLRFLPDGVLEDSADLIVVPGGGWADRSPHSLYAEVQRGLLPRKLAALHPQCTIMAAVCSGAMALSAAGLLKDRPAVTHRSALHELRSAGAQIIDARVVDDGDIVTCGGVTSSIDLALWLVERVWGAPLSAKIANGMEYIRNPSLHRARQAAG
jgi:transcriptional regulator GlxA family with amidase domain